MLLLLHQLWALLPMMMGNRFSFDIIQKRVLIYLVLAHIFNLSFDFVCVQFDDETILKVEQVNTPMSYVGCVYVYLFNFYYYDSFVIPVLKLVNQKQKR